MVTNYLLEKSRTVKPGQGERNFHVFYQLVQGAPRDERPRLCLLDSADAYPSLASCTSVEGIDDRKNLMIRRRPWPTSASTTRRRTCLYE